MSNIGSYEDRLKNFDWTIAEKELGYRAGEEINIGWYCSDRICRMGNGGKPALLWGNSTGEEKCYTYNDVRVYSNTVGAFLERLVKTGITESSMVEVTEGLSEGAIVVSEGFYALKDGSRVTIKELSDAGGNQGEPS